MALSADAFVGRLVERGLDAAEAPLVSRLFAAALDGHGTIATEAPAYACWVPGRVEVFGKHTDYAGGRTLVAALPRGFVFLASPRRDNVVQLLDTDSGDRVTFGCAQDSAASWSRYADVVVARLTRNFPGARRGAAVAFASNLPRAAGMSSSSALVVGLASSLGRLWALDERIEWRRNLLDPAARATYYACVENGLPFGEFEAEAGVGTFGGSEDHTAMLLAKPGYVSVFSYVPVRHIGDAPVPGGWRLVLASSGVTAEKAGGARAAYNELSEATAVLLRLWNAHYGPHRSLGAALASGAAAADRLRALIRTCEVRGWPAGLLEPRLEHFCLEDARVGLALTAFRRGDRSGVHEMSDASQRDADRLLANQIPETRALVECARACGAFASCSFGAGFGGGVWALIDRDRAEVFAAEWLLEYAKRFPAAAAQSFVSNAAPPLTEFS